MIRQVCECSDWSCQRSVQIPDEEVTQLRSQRESVIVAGCPNDPSSGEVFVEKRSGYSIYRQNGKD